MDLTAGGIGNYLVLLSQSKEPVTSGEATTDWPRPATNLPPLSHREYTGAVRAHRCHKQRPDLHGLLCASHDDTKRWQGIRSQTTFNPSQQRSDNRHIGKQTAGSIPEVTMHYDLALAIKANLAHSLRLRPGPVV